MRKKFWSNVSHLTFLEQIFIFQQFLQKIPHISFVLDQSLILFAKTLVYMFLYKSRPKLKKRIKFLLNKNPYKLKIFSFTITTYLLTLLQLPDQQNQRYAVSQLVTTTFRAEAASVKWTRTIESQQRQRLTDLRLCSPPDNFIVRRRTNLTR